MNIKAIREEFPILKQKMRDKPLVYFDNAATSLKPEPVISRIGGFYRTTGANIHRGVYELSERATLEYDGVREQVCRFINAHSDGHVIFTKGTTESVNLVAYAWGRKFLSEGDEIVTTEMEHHSNLIPWQELAKERGAVLKFIRVNADEGTLDLSSLDDIITERTKLVTVTAMSNVTGYMPDVAAIARAAHKAGAVMMADAAQYASHHQVDVQKMDCDFISFSSHKMCGPTGVGILYGRENLLEQMNPFLYGGDMIRKVWKDRATYSRLPDKFEAGTPNIAGVIGFGAALEFLEGIGMDNITRHEQELLAYIHELTKDRDDIQAYGGGELERRGGIFSFNFGSVHPHDTGAILDNEGVAVRTGFHCCQPLIRLLEIPGTVRASFYLYNTKEEIDIFIKALEKVKDVFL
jgi:cysteine desulfurase / selenocysteine lyase